MDKTTLIILLLLIIIIALLHQNDNSEISRGLDNTLDGIKNNNYYQDVKQGLDSTLEEIESNQYYQNARKGLNNTIDKIEDGISSIYNKEAFNNSFADTSNRIAANMMLNTNINIDTLPTGKGDHPVELISNNPPYVQIRAKKNDNFLTVTDINGFKEGDMIILNPNQNNSEMNFITGMGNNILRLKYPLKHLHLPNETVYNKYNNSISNNKIPFYKKPGFGIIKQESRDVAFRPEEETWNYNITGEIMQ